MPGGVAEVENHDVRPDGADDESRFGRGFTFALKFVVPIWVVIALVVIYFS